MNAMVGGDEEQLAINVIAKLTDLERQMAKANGITARAFREMTLTTRKATRQMEDDAARSATRINQAFASVGTKIGSVGQAFAVGGIAGLVGGGIAASLAGLINQAREAADSIAEIGTAAKMAGLPVKEFQEWAYVAEQTRIPLDAITDGLKELSLRADEFAVTGKGSAAEAFQRIGLSPEEVQQRLKDPSALLLEIVDRVRQLGDTAAGVRIFDELFGGQGGERMVALLDQGSDGINRMIDDAHDFGRVLDDEMIAKAQQIDAEFNQIANTVGITLKGAIVSAVASLSDFLDGLRAVENQRAATIQARQKSVMAEKADVARRIGEIEAGTSGGNSRGNVKAKGDLEIRFRQLDEEENTLIRELSSRPEIMNFEPKARDWTPIASGGSSGSKKKSGGGGGRIRDSSAKETEREREAVAKLIAELEEELSLIDATDAERRAAEISRRAGAAATEEERQRIIALNETIYQEGEAREKAKQALEEQKELLSGFITDLRNGASAGDAFANVIARLADRAQDQLLDMLFNGLSGAGGQSGQTTATGVGMVLPATGSTLPKPVTETASGATTEKAGDGTGLQVDQTVTALNGSLGQLTSGIGGAINSFLPGFGNLLTTLLQGLGNMGGMGSGSGTGGDIFGAIMGSLFNSVFASAKGNVFQSPGLHSYANTVVSRPTVFPFAKGGVGLMGEAGPEAIMPLRRDASGRLGVAATGGGGSVNREERESTNHAQIEIVPSKDFEARIISKSVRQSQRYTNQTVGEMGRTLSKATPGRVESYQKLGS